MASMTIRNLPEAVRAGLRLRAARRGRSMEAEARAILSEAVGQETGQAFDPAALQTLVAEMFGGRPPRLTRELLAERRRAARRERRR